MASFNSAQDFFVSNDQSKKIQINPKIPCPQSHSFLVPRPCRLREVKRAMQMRMTRQTAEKEELPRDFEKFLLRAK